jgi:hypothetical protein
MHGEEYLIKHYVIKVSPLSTIFQLLLLWQKLEYPEKTTDLWQVTEKLLSHNVLSSTPLHAWGSNSQHKW